MRIPTILLLGLAYGFLQAGVLDQALFNPDFHGADFQRIAHVPGIDVSAYHTVTFTAGHAAWSVATPIAVVESLCVTRGTTPWLGRRGLVAVTLLFLLGAWIIYADHVDSSGFRAAAPGRRPSCPGG